MAATAATAATAMVVASGCGTPTPTRPSAVAPTGTPMAGSAASASPTTAPVKPAGPPPRKGSVAWYVSQIPHFDAPPVPIKITTLATSGPAKLFTGIPVGNQKVAFLTIDDGWLKDPAMVTLLRDAHIPFTMFLTTDAIKSDPSFFTQLEGLGGVIEDHTITHGNLSQMDYARQQHEICGSRATLTKLYGRAPVLMRAPYGASNANTLKAAASCHIRAAVFWDEWSMNGKVAWQRPGGIHPGDMVLMHFDKDFKENFLAAVQAFHASGITPALLENYLVTNPPTPLAPITPSPAVTP